MKRPEERIGIKRTKNDNNGRCIAGAFASSGQSMILHDDLYNFEFRHHEKILEDRRLGWSLPDLMKKVFLVLYRITIYIAGSMKLEEESTWSGGLPDMS